jgi:hypothetical protein
LKEIQGCKMAEKEKPKSLSVTKYKEGKYYFEIKEYDKAENKLKEAETCI